jgi:hypothetical protein
MHSPGTYSFLVKKQDSKELEAYGIFYHCTIIADVPEHEEMWAEVTTGGGCSCNSKEVIHIHSVAEIGGGEWQSGKSSRSQTVPIE